MLSRIVGSFRRKNSSANKHTGSNNNIRIDEGDETYGEENLPDRNPYSRPEFMSLSPGDQVKSCDHSSRPVVIPKDLNKVPMGAGYAECINGGKSPKNEDQAAVGHFVLTNEQKGSGEESRKMARIGVEYFAVFDGHAGTGAALMASDQLVNHLQEKLVDIQDDLFSMEDRDSLSNKRDSVISRDSLIRGALEAAFLAFDEQISQERETFHISGGCTALVALVLLDCIYVAHAGDGRAIAYIGEEVIPMATEFTPETDGERIQYLAHIKPSLTHDLFSDCYFLQHPCKKDIGTRVLCRPPQRSGWHYKEVTEKDVKCPPLVSGQGKWARLMGMIGVTRGFGDHGLVIPGSSIHVKPFLTPLPEVRVLNLSEKQVSTEDVLVMGCDGLWDLLSTEQIGDAVSQSLARSRDDKTPDRYTKVAADLVKLSRGDNCGKGWKMFDGRDASFDDITCFVIPLALCLRGRLKT